MQTRSVEARSGGELAARKRTAPARTAAPRPPRLTLRADLGPREREVLRLMATGLTNAEIAARLTVGPATVKSQVAADLARTGTRDHPQAVIAAYEAGLRGP
ncbi:helix-turn-helix transcriptional regulator [Streptomyces sp. SCA2-2]|nr:helix-turn-helix transcriptional regulator [Streptomyces sp. SCA2-2]